MWDKIGKVLTRILDFTLSLSLILIFGAVLILVLPILIVGGILVALVILICWMIDPKMFKKKLKGSNGQ